MSARYSGSALGKPANPIRGRYMLGSRGKYGNRIAVGAIAPENQRVLARNLLSQVHEGTLAVWNPDDPPVGKRPKTTPGYLPYGQTDEIQVGVGCKLRLRSDVRSLPAPTGRLPECS